MGGSRAPVECFFDGACRGNQFAAKGPMWVAYVVGSEEHVHEIPNLVTPQGRLRSNNIAEYRALILLLERLTDLVRERGRGDRYTVSGDSQLVVRQMQGRYAVREPHLMPLHAEAAGLASRLPIAFRWIPRDRNRAGHLLE